MIEYMKNGYYKQNINKIIGTATQMSSQQIQGQIVKKTCEMDDCTKTGNYVEAENCRVSIQQLRKDYDLRVIEEMEQKHQKDSSELAESHEKEMQTFNNGWEKKLKQYESEAEKMRKQMGEKHEKELKAFRDDLEKQLSTKVKESSQLLNLRKKEQTMAKQKKFVEAHDVQEKIAQMEKNEQGAWINARNQKIDIALNKLKAKHEGEVAALQKKIKTTASEQNKNQGIEQNRLKLRYANTCKEMKMQQDKDILSQKGQFKSKGGSNCGDSPTMRKSRFKN